MHQMLTANLSRMVANLLMRQFSNAKIPKMYFYFLDNLAMTQQNN